MAKQVVMPQMGYDMQEGTLLRWIKQEGEPVERGESIAEIETDKVNLEIESFDSGVMRKHLVQEGQTVPVGEPIAIIGEADEEIEVPAEQPTAPSANQAVVTAEQATTGAQIATEAAEPDGRRAPEQVVERAPGERIRASPLVRRLAAEHDIHLETVQGTGPGGRIVKDDIMPLIGQPAAPAPAAAPPPSERPAPPAPPAAPPPLPGQPEYEERDLPRIRQTVARRMTESAQQAPHFYVTVPVDMTRAIQLLAQINEPLEGPQTVTINDLIIKAVALALRAFPTLNSSHAGTKLRVFKRIDVGFAVAIEGGLISPFIPDTDHKTLGEIALKTKDLSRRARNGGLRPEEYQGGTFTVSNLGMFGVESFTAIINPPQAAILAVGTAKKEPVYQDGQFKPVDLMRITLSADHRVADGAEVARFLAEVRRLLETPMLLLVS